MNRITQRTSPLSGSFRKFAVAFVALPLLAATLVQAQPSWMEVQLSQSGQGGTGSWQWLPAIVNTSSGLGVNPITYNEGSVSLSISNTTLGYDPFVSSVYSIQNNTAFTQTYNVITTLPISPAIPGGTRVGGSVQAGVSDANFNGTAAISTTPGMALYYGLIDGNKVLPLFSDPTTISILTGIFGDSTNASTSAGLPGGTIPGPAATTSIGIEFNFTLTPGDIATFSATFLVVPEPSVVGMGAVGGLLLLIARARRNR